MPEAACGVFFDVDPALGLPPMMCVLSLGPATMLTNRRGQVGVCVDVADAVYTPLTVLYTAVTGLRAPLGWYVGPWVVW